MTALRRVNAIRVFAVSALLLTPLATSWAQQRPAVAEKMAKTFGIDSFGQVDGLRYTFNVERPGVSVARSWEWNPKTDTVTFEGKDKDGKPAKVTYQRSQVSGATKEVDANFLNDQYWLLLPFHVIWDTNATVTDEGMQKLPLGDASGEKLVMKYPPEGGYSEGDTWDIYVGADGRIQEFVYHAGPKKPRTVIAPWTDYRKAGPLLFSLDHQSKAGDNPVHIFFSNLAVKLAGSQNWINAQ